MFLSPKGLWVAALCLMPVLFSAMGGTGAIAAEYVDAVGRSVVLLAPPQRVVSLVPSITETIYAIHAEQQLVGVTDFCDYPVEAKLKTSIGSYAQPNLEAVAELNPDLVIMDTAGSNPTLLEQLEQLGVPVYLVAARSLQDTLETVLVVGRLLGQEVAAQELVAVLRGEVDQVVSLNVERRVRTLVCVMVEPLIVAGADTLVNDLIGLAGGVNVGAGQTRYPNWSMETVLAYDPELIIVSPHPGTPQPNNFFSGWTQLQAVRRQQVVNVEADWLQLPGPRLVKGLQALATHIQTALNRKDSERRD